VQDEFRSIVCPQKEGHPDHTKTLCILNQGAIHVHCKVHGWMRVELRKGGKPLDFSDCCITVTKMPKDFHFSSTESPVLAVL
jgi:hypothetical protein